MTVNISLGQWSPTFLAPGTGFMEESFSRDGARGRWFRRNVTDGGQMKLHSLAHPPLSSCAAWFPTGRGLVLVYSPVVGDPCFSDEL